MAKQKKDPPVPEAEVVDALVVSNTPGALIAQAIEKGSDLSQLQTVLDVQIKWEANEAKKAYNLAMAEFKKNPPEIEKDLTVDFTPQGKGRVLYNHAGLANVASTINKALGVHGLSATWRTSQTAGNKGVTVTCIITHKLGHSEETPLTADPDNTGGKNAIQQVGSTVTYLERYTILAMTGLATKESDDDGVGSEIDYITEDQVMELVTLIDENIKDKKYKKDLLSWMKVESFDLIPIKQFKKAETAIKAYIEAAKK